MAQNDSTFSGFSDDDIPEICVDPNNGKLYTAVETSNGKTITYTFHSRKAFDKVIKQLLGMYAFTPNQAHTGQATTTTMGNDKLKIIAYNSGKLVVQGNKCKLWRHTVFKAISEMLTQEEPKPKTTVRQAYFFLPPQKPRKTKSTSVLGRISKTIFGPSIGSPQTKPKTTYNSNVVSLSDVSSVHTSDVSSVHTSDLSELEDPDENSNKNKSEKSKTVAKNGGKYKGRPETWQFRKSFRFRGKGKTLQHSSSMPSISVKMTEEETQLKTVHVAEDQNPAQNLPDESTKDDVNIETLTATLDCSHESGPCNKQTAASTTQLEIMQAEINQLTKDKAILQNSLKKQSKELEKHKTETCSLNSKLKSAIKEIDVKDQRIKKLEKETHCATKKISDLNSQTLILEEENSILVQANKKLTSENKKIQTTVNRKAAATDITEDILTRVDALTDKVGVIETKLQEVHDKVKTGASEADILLLNTSFNNTLTKEISELKSSTTTGISRNQPIVVEDQPPEQAVKQSEPQTAASNNRGGTGKKSVFIIGDSVTKSLNPKRLSSDKLYVSIKTNHGALIKDIDSNIKSDSRLRKSDAIIVHAGINNISEADNPNEIMRQYTDLITNIKKVNTKAKIIVSSVLPKKYDKLSTNCIKEVNFKLEQKCKTEGQMQFMDNTPKFTSEGSVNKSLFTDEVHLTSKGATVLAKNITDTLHQCLNSGPNSKSNQAGNFYQASLQKTMGQHQQPRQPRQLRPPRMQPTMGHYQQPWGPRRPGPPRRLPPWMMAQYWGPPPHYY